MHLSKSTAQLVTGVVLALIAGTPFALMARVALPFFSANPIVTGLSVIGVITLGACAVIVAFKFGCDVAASHNRYEGDHARFPKQQEAPQ